jgi:hypothetical protein
MALHDADDQRFTSGVDDFAGDGVGGMQKKVRASTACCDVRCRQPDAKQTLDSRS